MSDDTIRLVTIGRIIRRRWRLLTLFTVMGALVGYGASSLFPPRYTTSASVLLPGTWEERELLTQAEIATSSVVIDRSAAALRWGGVDGNELREQVTAKATDGNIIKISGTADTPEHAQQLSDQVARQFVVFAAQLVGTSADPKATAQPEALRQLVTQTSRRISELADATDPGRTVESVQTRTELAKLRTALQEAVSKLDQVDPGAHKADMVVMGPAVRPTDETPPTRTQLIVAGALLFFLVAAIGHLTAARMSRRLRTEPEIVAALGAGMLGSVQVPTERLAHRPKEHGPRAWGRRLLGLDVRWDTPTPQRSGDEADRQVRYRRVCARLRDQLLSPGGLLVVVPEGDEIARQAAGRLSAEAGDVPSPRSPDGERPALRVVEVSVSQPMVPDRNDEAGVLIVLSAGSWTAAELSGIAGACADAAHEVVGVVLAGTVWARPGRSGGSSRADAVPALAAGSDATGGTG
ncbi:Wzz/FepE/Etk N-terminal domain-containing protein [Streptomyces sp. NPDC058872]|uniref:Wzz/FepE/Etk N-terminal domain-containing protein n=1 Tax=Streptomyces sp. NPDC058872 TaxID=3346661 RepID=UPI0036A131A8